MFTYLYSISVDILILDPNHDSHALDGITKRLNIQLHLTSQNVGEIPKRRTCVGDVDPTVFRHTQACPVYQRGVTSVTSHYKHSYDNCSDSHK